jgi:hypothetical protein
MESFEVIVNAETYRIICNNPDNCTFSVFNYATCHVIKRNEAGIWNAVEHRFGTDNLPLKEIGKAIDKYHKLLTRKEGIAKFKSTFEDSYSVLFKSKTANKETSKSKENGIT